MRRSCSSAWSGIALLSGTQQEHPAALCHPAQRSSGMARHHRGVSGLRQADQNQRRAPPAGPTAVHQARGSRADASLRQLRQSPGQQTGRVDGAAELNEVTGCDSRGRSPARSRPRSAPGGSHPRRFEPWADHPTRDASGEHSPATPADRLHCALHNPVHEVVAAGPEPLQVLHHDPGHAVLVFAGLAAGMRCDEQVVEVLEP